VCVCEAGIRREVLERRRVIVEGSMSALRRRRKSRERKIVEKSWQPVDWMVCSKM
jgi:hypothetical protein